MLGKKLEERRVGADEGFVIWTRRDVGERAWGGGGGEVLRVLSSRSKGEQALTEAPGTLKVVESLICRKGKKEVLKRVKISKVK